jgi:hypothetical protein
MQLPTQQLNVSEDAIKIRGKKSIGTLKKHHIDTFSKAPAILSYDYYTKN